MNRVLFIDRDGTLVKEPEDYQVDSFEKLVFYPGMLCALSHIVGETDYELVMVTNQDGLGTERYPEKDFERVQNFIMRTLENEGIRFREIIIDRTWPEEKASTRKPGTVLLTHYMTGGYDLEHSFVIGDRITDMVLAKNLGARGIWLNDSSGLGISETEMAKDDLAGVVALETRDWHEIYSFLRAQQRRAVVMRETRETKVTVEIALDGSGRTDISTGLGFFDHMLEQLGFHGVMDLAVRVTGDLHVDEHHTIEDTALALGQAFTEAVGAKKGINRYGFVLPMDESLAQVAVDFGGRNFLVWKADFRREKIGDMPTEMFYHFFKSFTDTAKCTLNIQAEGINEHHKIEAIFKAFARALHMAVSLQDNGGETSTKGSAQWRK